MQTNRLTDDQGQVPGPTLTRDEILLARRRFLVKCGRYAAVTPPIVTLLLAPRGGKFAVAQSGGVSQTRP
jgi:hypothetical protein